MKKYLFAALGAGLLLTSCQSDEPLAPGNGLEQQVAFTVSLPDAVSTRAGGTNSAAGGVSNNVGANVTFNVALYLIGGSETVPVYTASDVVSSTGDRTSATFEPTLVIGEQYRVVAYAKFDDDTLNGELTAINVTPEINNEQKDEYFANTIVTAAPELSATLKRPFGKLRLIAEDLHEAERQYGAEITNVDVTYQYTRPAVFNAYAPLSATDNVYGVFGEYDVTKAQTLTAAYGEYEADTNDSRTIFVDYIPANTGDQMMPFTVKVTFANNKTYTREFRQDIPVRRNWLTTLKGRLFTIDSDLTLTIEEGFEGETESNFANDLEWVAANGGTVNLTEDITLTEALNVTKDMVINLAGKTLTGAVNVANGVQVTVNNGKIVNTNREVSGITSNGDLTLNDVEITSARHAIRIESGKAVINGGVYMVAPISKSTLHALNVGDNGTTAEVIIKGGTFIGPKGTMADSGSAVNVRSGSTVAIEGGDFSGGKTKTLANGGTLTVTGGSFDQNPTAFVANGYKALKVDNLYYVLLEDIAKAASDANVTSVTESTSEFKTAIATDNGEGTLFMWNDVAYIAEYGKVNILASEEGKTTVRAIVEESAAVKEANVVEGIEVVGNRTFRKCANLETVALPNTLTEIGPAVFQSCSKLANVTIPANVKTIGEGAFAECTSLTSINIPDGVTRLEKEVLRTTGLTSIEIPASVTYFGTFAFRDCKQLKEVVINAPEFTTEANAFGVMAGALPGTVIYVVNAEMKAYLESTLTYKSQFVVKLISERQ